jgi:hypothetical protein
MKNKDYDIVALGEAVIDLTQTGILPNGNIQFEAVPGGAPSNMIAAAALGGKTALIGVVLCRQGIRILYSLYSARQYRHLELLIPYNL